MGWLAFREGPGPQIHRHTSGGIGETWSVAATRIDRGAQPARDR
ncbi:MAG: hypothetical protein SCH98_17080 [Deferrisomatales bacterium]|nr:hypothetical protein [Deferrisomatales bacterium]